MAKGKNSPESQKEKDETKKRAAERAEKRKNRAAARQEKAAEYGMSLCSLTTVAVKKTTEGYNVMVFGSTGRKAFTIPPGEANQVLRDIETAIQVIRSQQ